MEVSVPPEHSKAAIKRDKLLAELDAYHEEMLAAARNKDTDTIIRLVEERHDTIERLKRVVSDAPIPEDVGKELERREGELQRILSLELSGMKTDMGQKARRGSAALRYKRLN